MKSGMKPAWASIGGTAAVIFALVVIWTFMEAAERVLGYDPTNLLTGLFVVGIGLLGYRMAADWIKEVEVKRSVEWMPGDPVPKDRDFALVLDRLEEEFKRLELEVGSMHPLWSRREEDVALVYDRLVDAANTLEDANEAAGVAAGRSR